MVLSFVGYVLERIAESKAVEVVKKGVGRRLMVDDEKVNGATMAGLLVGFGPKSAQSKAEQASEAGHAAHARGNLIAAVNSFR